MTIDEAKIESDASGFHLVLTGDFANVFADYLAADPSRPASSCVNLVLSRDAALQLFGQTRNNIGPWAETIEAALRDEERRTASLWRQDARP